MSQSKKGFVYVLSNTAYNGLYKIGYSINVERRIKELSRATGVPRPFKVEIAREYLDAKRIEKLAHKKFGGTASDKEFFKVPLHEIILFLDELYIQENNEKADTIKLDYQAQIQALKAIEHSHIQLEAYKKYNQLLTNEEKLKKWWSKLGVTFKVQILKRKATKIGVYTTYLTKQELIFVIEQVLQYDFIPENLFEPSPYQKELNESNINEIAKAIFPILKEDYFKWYQKVTGKEVLEVLSLVQLKSILRYETLTLKTHYDNIWIDLIPMINLHTISVHFEIKENDIQCLRGFPHLDILIMHKLKFTAVESLNQLNHIKKVSFRISLSKKQIDEGAKQKIMKAFPNHKCYIYPENLKFGRQKWQVYFEIK